MSRVAFLFLFIFSFHFNASCFGQEEGVLDSLLNELESPRHDTEKVDLLNAVAVQYRNSEMDKVLVYADSALSLAETIEYPNGRVRAHFNIGNMYYIKGQLSKTLDHYLKALKILREIGDKKGEASALMGIGNVHSIQKNYDKALAYQQRALKKRLELNDSLGIAGSYNNIGSIYMSLEQYEKALDYHFKSLEIKKKLNYWKGLSSSYGNIGAAYTELGENEKALEFQKKAYKIRKKINNKKGMVMSHTDIGNILYEQGKYNEALKEHKKAVELAKEVSFLEGEVTALLSLSRTYEKKGDLRKALDTYKEYAAESDSLLSLKKSKEIANLESVLTAEKQKRKISLLEKDQTIKDLKIKSQQEQIQTERSKLMAILSVLVLVISLVGFLIYTVQRKKKANRKMAYQKEIVEEQNREITESIHYSKRIQDAMLPSKQRFNQYIEDSFIFYRPKDIVSGDFYWLEPHPENKKEVLFAAADCTGHGVPGAMVSLVCNHSLVKSVREFNLTDPGKILDKTKELVIESFSEGDFEVMDGMDISLCCFNPVKRELTYAGANNPLYIVRNKELIQYKADRQPIGKFPSDKRFTTHKVQLEKGDDIYLFSDGYVDQFGGPKSKKLMYPRFKELLVSVSGKAPIEQKQLLEKKFDSWRGNNEQLDDVCIVGVKV